MASDRGARESEALRDDDGEAAPVFTFVVVLLGTVVLCFVVAGVVSLIRGLAA